MYNHIIKNTKNVKVLKVVQCQVSEKIFLKRKSPLIY